MKHRKLYFPFTYCVNLFIVGPYVCDQCGASFVRSYKLVIHKRRVHTGERPYSCEHCEWRGVDSSDLIHHRKKHHKNPVLPLQQRDVILQREAMMAQQQQRETTLQRDLLL